MWREAAKNSLTIYAGSLLSGLFVFLYRICVIRTLSVEDYALFAVLTTMFTWIAVFSHFDLYAGVSKCVSECSEDSRLAEAKLFYHHAIVIALILSCAGICIGVIFSVKHYAHTYTLIFFFIGLIPFSLMTVSDGILKGTNRFAASAGMNVLLGLSRLLVFLPLVFLSSSVRLDHALMAFSTAMIVPFVAMHASIRRIGFFPLGIGISQGTPIYRALFDFSKWVTVTDLFNSGLLLASTFILSMYSLVDTAIFNVVIVLYMVVQIGYGAITSVLIPQISRAAAQGEQIRTLNMREFAVLAASMVTIVALIHAVPFKEQALSLILNNDAYSHALSYLLILLLISPFRVFSMVNKGIVQGLNDTRATAFVALSAFVVNLILVIPLYRIFGLFGVFAAMGTGYIVEFILSQRIAIRIVSSIKRGQVSWTLINS